MTAARESVILDLRERIAAHVLFHEPDRCQLQDIVTCIWTGKTIDDVGFERERHADRYLKPPDEMQRLFPRYREALNDGNRQQMQVLA